MTKIDPDGNIEYVQSGFFEFVVANSANIDSILNIRHKSISERAKQFRTNPD
ncbi:hypothetical protein AB9P05_10625 [Roseivirga sp. BDSF3-8]|uniref:hypothetical protein n=1 Tax=Roseivirga sp. BDSF3-8 TaxID=3241598 RepID=UPI00353257E5